MKLDAEAAHTIAVLGFEYYTLPEGFDVEDTSGFSSEESSSRIEFSKPIFYYPEGVDKDADDACTSTAFFNIRINLETAEVEDAYVITSSGGDLIGELTDEALATVYQEARVEPPFSNSAPKI